MIHTRLEDIPRGHYRTIVADPPWKFRNVHTGGTMKSGSASKYPTMSTAQIIMMDVRGIAHKDAMLFLWVPCAIKDHGLLVMEAWGFTYKTTLYWIKGKWEPVGSGDECLLRGRYGMGSWFSNTIEECLFGVRGTVPAFKSMKRNIMVAHPGKHSEKPEAFWELIHPYVRHPAIELFARAAREGIDSYGNEVTHEIPEV
jgi:N6-adenosine-specific RNA methylase IME4